MALTQSQLAAVQASMSDPRWANASVGPQKGMVYAFGKAVPVNSKNDIYSLINQAQQQGIDQETIAREFSNNPFGISYQELLNVPSNAASAGSGGAPKVNIMDKINALNNLYNVMYQDLGAMTQEQRNLLEKGYGQQQAQTQKNYEQQASQLPSIFAARGTRYSSDYENAAKKASDMYDQAIQQIQQEKEQKLSDLGRQYTTQESALKAGQSQLAGLGQYGSEADAAALNQQLMNLSQQQAGMGTQAGYLGKLQGITSSQTNTAGNLQKQLADLAQSSIPQFAKQTISSGWIKQGSTNPQDQAYYQDYFDKLQQQGTQSPGA